MYYRWYETCVGTNLNNGIIRADLFQIQQERKTMTTLSSVSSEVSHDACVWHQPVVLY